MLESIHAITAAHSAVNSDPTEITQTAPMRLCGGLWRAGY